MGGRGDGQQRPRATDLTALGSPANSHVGPQCGRASQVVLIHPFGSSLLTGNFPNHKASCRAPFMSPSFLRGYCLRLQWEDWEKWENALESPMSLGGFGRIGRIGRTGRILGDWPLSFKRLGVNYPTSIPFWRVLSWSLEIHPGSSARSVVEHQRAQWPILSLRFAITRQLWVLPHRPALCQLAFQNHHAPVGIRHQLTAILKPFRLGLGFLFTKMDFTCHEKKQ